MWSKSFDSVTEFKFWNFSLQATFDFSGVFCGSGSTITFKLTNRVRVTSLYTIDSAYMLHVMHTTYSKYTADPNFSRNFISMRLTLSIYNQEEILLNDQYWANAAVNFRNRILLWEQYEVWINQYLSFIFVGFY